LKPAGSENVSITRLVGSLWIASDPYPDESFHLYDRDTAQAWKYSSQALRLKDASPECLLFAELNPADSMPGRNPGCFRVFSPAMSETGAFELAGQQAPG